METLIYVVLDALITGTILYLAGHLTAVKIAFKEAVICVLLSSLLGFIPVIGWLVSIIAYFILLKRYTGAPIWPNIILMVLVSKLLSVIIIAMLGGFN